MRTSARLASRAVTLSASNGSSRPANDRAIAEVFRRNPEDGFESGPGQMPAVVAGGSPAAFAAVDSVAGLFFALAFGRGLGRRLAFRVLTENENI